MDVRQLREAVKSMYPNESWARQVDRMPSYQIETIYLRNLENPPPLPQKEQPPEQGRLF